MSAAAAHYGVVVLPVDVQAGYAQMGSLCPRQLCERTRLSWLPSSLPLSLCAHSQEERERRDMLGLSAAIQPDPKEQVNKWKKEMRSEARKLDRQILRINREEEKIKRSIKDAAKRGDTSSCKTYAREIVRSRKAVTRLHTTKAQMNSVVMQMQNQLSQQKLMGTLSKSSDIMKAMNRLVKVEGISETMQTMQREMCKAGVIEEMVDNAFEALNDEDDEAEADAQVSQVLAELAAQQTGGMAAAPRRQVAQAAAEQEEEEEEDMETMRARLEQIKQ